MKKDRKFQFGQYGTFKPHFLRCWLLQAAMLKKKSYIGDSEYKMAITVLLLFICQSLSLVNMYYCPLPVQAQPWQMLTGPRPPAAVATGEGLAGWAERTAWLCVGRGGKGGRRMRAITDQQWWWDTNTNPSSLWNVPPTLAVPMVTHIIATAL